MRNKALINLLQPSYSPFFFDRAFENDFRQNSLPEFQENEEAYFTSLDMPGVRSEDINIDVEENYVRVTAERKDNYNSDSKIVRRYDFVLSIPKNVDKDNISAHYENGVVNFALHKTKEDKTKKKITVSTGEKPKSWTNFLNFKKENSGKTQGEANSLN